MNEITPPIALENQGKIIAFPASQNAAPAEAAPVAIELPPLTAPAESPARKVHVGDILIGALMTVVCVVCWATEMGRNFDYGLMKGNYGTAVLYAAMAFGVGALPIVARRTGWTTSLSALDALCFLLTIIIGISAVADIEAARHREAANTNMNFDNAQEELAAGKKARERATAAYDAAKVEAAKIPEKRSSSAFDELLKRENHTVDLETQQKNGGCSTRPESRCATALAQIKELTRLKGLAESREAFEKDAREAQADIEKANKQIAAATNAIKGGQAEKDPALSVWMTKALAYFSVVTVPAKVTETWDFWQPAASVLAVLLFSKNIAPSLALFLSGCGIGVAPAPVKVRKPGMLGRLAAVRVGNPLASIRKAKAEVKQIAAEAAAQRKAEKADELDRKAVEAAREAIAELSPADKARQMLAEMFTASEARMTTADIKAAFAKAWEVRHADLPNALTDAIIREAFTARGFQDERKGGKSGWLVALA